MKPPAKPITSPGRSDKYPTPSPLMTSFMRTNVGNKSRSGRLRSTSPMFTRKKNSTPETQEPSSPKVTCMGQVRGPGTGAPAASSRRRAKRAGDPARRKRKNSCGELWRKWVPFSFGAVFCYNAKIEEDKERRETRIAEVEALGFGLDDEEEEVGFERKAMTFVYANDDDDDVTSAPPKNALLLTRCRSAPYRSTSLAYRFWGSPNRAQEEEEEQSQTVEEETEQSKTGEEEEEEERIENGGPTLESEKRSEEKIEVASVDDLKEAGEFNGSDSERPLILRRCKSEPARTAAEKFEVDSLIHSQQVFVIN